MKPHLAHEDVLQYLDGYSLERRQLPVCGKESLLDSRGQDSDLPDIWSSICAHRSTLSDATRRDAICRVDASGERLGEKLGAVVAVDSDNWTLVIIKGVILMQN